MKPIIEQQYFRLSTDDIHSIVKARRKEAVIDPGERDLTYTYKSKHKCKCK